MLLAKDEVLIKEWCYANRKSLFDNVQSTLTLTNKRIISSERGNLAVEQHEVPLDYVKGISTMRAKNSLFGAIVCFVFAFIFLLMGAAMMAGEVFVGGAIFIFLMMMCLALGVVQILFRKGVFALVLTTEGKEGTPIIAGAASRRFVKKVANFFIVQVDLAVADDIIETIGALVIENMNK